MTPSTTYTEAEARAATLDYFHGDGLATDVFVSKYALRDLAGNLYERTPADMHRRLAREFARIEARYPNPVDEETIVGLLSSWAVVPQGSPMSALGNPFQRQSASNCFVADSPHDSQGGIMRTDEELVQIMKRRGGVGIDLSTIRPAGLPVANAARSTDGVGTLMERYSNSTRGVAQGGRRGALMLTISVHHPDVLLFSNIKRDKRKVTGANVSVRFSDEFMRAVRDGTTYTQRFPCEGPGPYLVEKQVDAGEVWRNAMQAMRDRNDPGAMFWDTITRMSPADCYADVGYRTISTNPCLSGDTRIGTQYGLVKIRDLAASAKLLQVTTDSRVEPASHVNSEARGTVTRDASAAFQSRERAEVFRVVTRHGHEIKATAGHKFPTPRGFVELQDLVVGDLMMVQSGEGQWGTAGSEALGHVIGWVEGDGCLASDGSLAYLDFHGAKKPLAEQFVPWCHEVAATMRSGNGHEMTFGARAETAHDVVRVASPLLLRALAEVGYREKGHVPEVVWRGTRECVRGYLRAFFAADGSSNNPKDKGFSVRLSQSNPELLREVQTLLLNFGIPSALYLRSEAKMKTMPDGRGGEKDYPCQAIYEIIIGKQNAVAFAERIGFMRAEHAASYAAWKDSWIRGPYRESFTDEIVSIEPAGEEAVYCLTQPSHHAFIANGIASANCGEIPLSAYDSCRLMLLNLATFVRDPFTPQARFDLPAFERVAGIAQRLMDDLVDLELEAVDGILAKIDADPEPDEIKQTERALWQKIRAAGVGGRRTGLGITALGDVFAYLGMAYGSPESIALTSHIYRAQALAAYRSSVQMLRPTPRTAGGTSPSPRPPPLAPPPCSPAPRAAVSRSSS
jgi:ribonucleoside-diphosphate reductase alpha chain